MESLASMHHPRNFMQILQDHTEYHRMQCNFRTTCIRKPVLKFLTFARLTTVPMRDFTTEDNIEEMQEAFWRWKPLKQFWRWKPLEFTGERSHSGLEKSYQTKLFHIVPNFLNQWRHSPGAFTAFITEIGRGGIKVTSNAVMFVSGNPTHQRSFHVLFFSILFCFPVWSKRNYIINQRWTMIQRILNLFTSKNCRHGRKVGPNIHKRTSFLFFAEFLFLLKTSKYQNKDTFMTLQTSYGELRN